MLLEAGGRHASYEGTGTIADVEQHLGPAIGDLLGSLDAADPGDLRTLADLAGIIGPESPDAWLAQGLVAESSSGSSTEAFTALVLRFPTAPVPVDWADPAVGEAP